MIGIGYEVWVLANRLRIPTIERAVDSHLNSNRYIPRSSDTKPSNLHIPFYYKFLFLVLLVPSTAAAQSVHGDCDAPTSVAYLDYNNVRAAVYNNGALFWRGGQPVYTVPKSDLEPKQSIFLANLWLGGLVEGELRVAASTYGPWEYWPGPIDENGQAPADCSEYDRMYKVSMEDVIAYESGEDEINQDFLDWPVHLGAPVIDGDGIPGNYNLLGGDRPKIIGQQNVWWIMNDRGNEHGHYLTDPLGVEIRSTAFSIRNLDHFDNTTFYKYEIKNRSDKRIDDMYIGLYVDHAMGNEYDDFVASDSLLGMGYAYNGEEVDESVGGYGDRPPAFGVDFVDGPLADSDLVDNDFDGEIDELGEKLQMTSFHLHFKHDYLNGLPYAPEDVYRYMQSILRDDAPVTYGNFGRGYSDQPTKFMYSGEPPNFWTEENTHNLDTRSFASNGWVINSLGPVDLDPEESKSVIIAILWAQGEDRLDSVRLLKEASRYVQVGIDAGVHEDPVFLSRLLPRVENVREELALSVEKPYPNPSLGAVHLSYTLNAPAHVEISLFDLHGRLVKAIMDGSGEEGRKSISFTLGNRPAGQYFLRYQIAGSVQYFPITLLRD